MSGGVDSSVAAALLKKQGFDVLGVFMRFWSESPKKGVTNKWNKCCSPQAEERARRVAGQLDIPFYVFDFRKEFKKKVVDYFIQEYKAGRTPNPCVVCNKEIKFGLLLKKAFALEADFVATGHYARLSFSKKHNNFSHREKFCSTLGLAPSLRSGRGRSSSEKFFLKDSLTLRLLRAKDKEKDQSYFLWQLSQKELRRCLFPLGDYTKKEVRELAKKFKLPVSSLVESQEVCFVHTNLADFLKKYMRLKPGRIIDTRGRVLGRHKGLASYTIGQRKGMNLPGGPWWVLRKDLKRNVLVVTKKEKDLMQKELTFVKANWISGFPPRLPAKVEAKIRYRSKSAPAVINKKGRVVFKKAQRAVTSGQSIVFYRSQELIGGGIIK